MAAVTATNNSSGQGIIKVFSFSAVSDASTFAYSGPVKSWGVENKTDSATTNAAYSAGVFTFKVSTGTPAVDLWVLL